MLVAACHRWPDTCCLTAEGKEVLSVESIREILSADDLLPKASLVSSLAAGRQDSEPECSRLDKLYALRTESSHSERVRRSELIHYLFLSYLEVRLVDLIHRSLHRLSGNFTKEESRTQVLSELQYERNYLSMVSCELGRR